MIFVTVGNADPFDRLVEAVDQWAGHHREIPVFLQIGSGKYQPIHCQYARNLPPAEYRARFSQARFVVAHAGMGAIITALELQKAIILLPRLAKLGEQRNEHQLATAKHWHNSTLITVANSAEELHVALNKAIELADSIPAIAPDECPGLPSQRYPVGPSLINFVREFVGGQESDCNASKCHDGFLPQNGNAIFLTVGNTDPFDRLVAAVDQWAGRHPAGGQVFAQIGNGSYTPSNCRFVRFLSPTEYRDSFARAGLVIGHAGMGTIITAIEQRKLVALLPRLADRGEVRNQHQLATVRHFCRLNNVLVAQSEEELSVVLDKALDLLAARETSDRTESAPSPTQAADPSLITFVRHFVSQNQ